MSLTEQLRTFKPALKKALIPFAAPKNVIGIPFANKLGLQVVRVIKQRCLWHIRRSYPSNLPPEYRKALDDDGILVLPDFFPQEIFKKIEDEFKRLEHCPSVNLVKNYRNTNTDWKFGNVPQNNAYPNIHNYLELNPLIRKVVTYVTRKKVHYAPRAVFESISVPHDKMDDKDGATAVHSDRYYPTMKAFLYMQDVSEADGAFVFCPGSHKVNRRRLWHEYEISYREAQAISGRMAKIPKKLVDIDRAAISPEMKKIHKPESICGKKNTLVLANTCGYHARGVIVPGGNRQLIRMCLHYVNAPYISQRMVHILGYSPTRLS